MKNQDLPNKKKKCTNHNKSHSVLECRFNLLEAKGGNISLSKPLHTMVLWQYNNALFHSKYMFQIKSTKFQFVEQKSLKIKLKKNYNLCFASCVSLQDSKIWNG